MARNLGVLVRNLLPNSKCIQNQTLKTLTLASSNPITPSSQAKPFSNSLPTPKVNFLQQRHRRLSSPFSGSRRSRFTNLKSGLQFLRMTFSLITNNLKDKAPESLVFFFTAPAADTCTVMYSSVVRELIEQYPNVLGYKIDASKEDFDCAMTAFSVRAVRTSHQRRRSPSKGGCSCLVIVPYHLRHRSKVVMTRRMETRRDLGATSPF